MPARKARQTKTKQIHAKWKRRSLHWAHFFLLLGILPQDPWTILIQHCQVSFILLPILLSAVYSEGRQIPTLRTHHSGSNAHSEQSPLGSTGLKRYSLWSWAAGLEARSLRNAMRSLKPRPDSRSLVVDPRPRHQHLGGTCKAEARPGSKRTQRFATYRNLPQPCLSQYHIHIQIISKSYPYQI